MPPVQTPALNQATRDIIDAMQPISLAEMDSVKLMDRVDTKYVTSGVELNTLLHHVREHYRVLTINEIRLSKYSTLYFDSPDHDSYLQHHNGRKNRHKVRMREYLSSGMCFLEIKHKNNKGRTDKQRIPIQTIDPNLSREAAEFLKAQGGSQSDLTPQLWTRFTRITLVDYNCLERATIDCNLEFSYGEIQESLPGTVIAEVKQASDNRTSTIRQQLRQQRVRPMRVSKYCLGVALLKPELKSNNFKSKLRAVRKIA